MAFKDIFHFKEEDYKVKVHNFAKTGSYQELATREVAKRRRVFSTKVRIVVTSVLLLPTSGATGFGLFMALRQRNVAKKKYKHIVEAMHAHGHPLPIPKRSDKVVPLVITLTIYTLTFGLLYGLDEFGDYASQEVLNSGMQTTGNLVSDAPASEAAQFMSDPTAFLHGVVHGAETQVGELQAAVSVHETIVQSAAHMATPTAETPVQYFSGAMTGYQYAPEIEEDAVYALATQTLEAAAKRRMTHNIRRKPIGSRKTHVFVTESAIPEAALV